MHPSPLHYSTMRPQAPASMVHDPKKDELRTAPWYWGSITREQAKNILFGKPDGSFLVRDAQAKKGEYTLTLMKDGNEKLIKICRLKNNNYGFVDAYQFNTVVDMINYYMSNSLKIYNKTLDITLSNAIICPYYDDSQPQGDLRLLSDEFIRCSQLLLQQEQALDQKKTSFNNIREELAEKKLHQNAFNNAENMLRSQMTLIESFMNKPPAVNSVSAGGAGGATANASGGAPGSNTPFTRQEVQQHMRDNLAHMFDHLGVMHTKMERLNQDIKSLKEEEQLLERQINATKPELQELQLRKDKHIERLKGFNLTDDDLNVILEVGFDKWQHNFEKASNQPHRIESLWFIKDAKRHDAELLLNGAPTGTYLIRARDVGHYALSIACKGGIHHCIIYQTESGLGFAAPYNIYPTLKHLVEHYACNSLEEHNDTLTTVLRIPVLYWTQNKQHILEQMQEELELEQLELEQEQERLALEATTLMPPPPPSAPSAPIPTTRSREHSSTTVASSVGSSVGAGQDTIDGSLGGGGETETTPPASISPSNFSSSQ